MNRSIGKGITKRLFLLLTVILTFTLFATGCGDSNSPPPDDLSSISSNVNTPSPAVPSASDSDGETEPASSTNTEADPGETPAQSEAPSSVPTEVAEGSSFEIHYIDVGQADAALVLCDGQAMLIDGGNAEDSNLIYAYLKKLSLDHLQYIVCTHAHEDHVGGLAGALNYATVDVAFSPVTSYDSRAFGNFVTYLDKQGVSITIPKAGDSFSLGSATVSILGPINSSDDPNNTSIVLRIVYGDTSFLFTGDAEREEEQDILNAGYTLDSTVLKVGHHGSETSTSYVFLREIMPEYAVISVGTGNSYGHPTDAVLSRLRDADVKVYRTDLQGDVICTSDGKTVSFSVARNADADTLASVGPNSTQSGGNTGTTQPEQTVTPSQEEPTNAPVGTDYILNTNTHKFHYPGCSSVKQMAEKNKQSFTGTRDEVIAMGYDPCGRCHP
ncbi:MBL fold metallo-hydrolase [Acutalibacter sp. JLR.KK004]|uniref:MBL fold metallo-hydrolase n=1 Tax=Acutalibacter sp. JLR.KK004 TaxID=3112622 RepID=UPI002FF2D8A4